MDIDIENTLGQIRQTSFRKFGFASCITFASNFGVGGSLCSLNLLLLLF